MVNADTDEATAEALRSAISSVAPEVLARRLKEIVRVDIAGVFASLRTPTMYLAGARDRLVGAAESNWMKSVRPDLEIHALEAPHLVLQARPAEAAEAAEAAEIIARFLA